MAHVSLVIQLMVIAVAMQIVVGSTGEDALLANVKLVAENQSERLFCSVVVIQLVLLA